jgi:hypothetical protein
MTSAGAHYQSELSRVASLRDQFALNLDVRPMRWSSYNVSRMLRLTGERPERVKAMRRLLGDLGMGHASWAGIGGVFDHGELWGRDRTPLMIVGHPYQIDADERAYITELARFSMLRVNVDDRVSYYGFGTHHVRIGLAEVRRPFAKPPSTYKTRSAALAARRAFAEEMGTQ